MLTIQQHLDAAIKKLKIVKREIAKVRHDHDPKVFSVECPRCMLSESKKHYENIINVLTEYLKNV